MKIVLMLLMLLVCASLVACATTPVAATPQIVTITKAQYVPLPAADLTPCTMATQQIATGADVVAAWQRTLEALAVCNAQIGNIKRLNDTLIQHQGKL